MGGVRGVEVINSKNCSKLFVDSIPSMNLRVGLQMFPASASVPSFSSQPILPSSTAPFSGLVICVTGLSKEARKQVMDATERLGGQYSPHLHPQCTHLVVQSSCGRKFEHALKHGSRNGFFIVKLGWFVDSVRRNVRLSESQYGVKSIGENGVPRDDLDGLFHYASAENSCFPVGMLENFKQSDTIVQPHLCSSEKELGRSTDSILSGHSLYVDADVSAELQSKVVEAATSQGATLVDQWRVGRSASHVVCEGPCIQKYLGHSDNLVTPLWVLKTAKEKRVQRLVHISADLARHVGTVLENVQSDLSVERCQTPIRPITPNSLLDSICWTISEPTSSASIYTESSSVEDATEHHTSVFFDANGDTKESQDSFVNFSRKITESEKTAVIFKNHFLTILFPVDRFGEMGPCSRIFFSDMGFTCLQVLDYIYAFYQENMSNEEVKVAIHTDSRHADRLRSMYSSKEATRRGYVDFKHIDFLGSRRSFEMLKRVTGDNNSNVYELVIRA